MYQRLKFNLIHAYCTSNNSQSFLNLINYRFWQSSIESAAGGVLILDDVR